MHSHSRRQLILESGCSHQVAVFPLCQCPLFLHLFLLLQLCMASRQTGQTFFDLFFDFKQACTISCWMFWFPYLSSVKLFRQNKKMHACWLASARFLPAQFTILFGDLKVCYTIVTVFVLQYFSKSCSCIGSAILFLLSSGIDSAIL